MPQHVLRFWETRFTTIKPLKRGGGRRYYRPDDVDLLKGIRQLLYGQGYTIRGVQRILKEDGLRFVQGVGRGEALPAPTSDAGYDDPEAGDFAGPASDQVDEVMPAVSPGLVAQPVAPGPPVGEAARDRILAALDELLECRRLLDALKRG